jgi:hypothetical protein
MGTTTTKASLWTDIGTALARAISTVAVLFSPNEDPSVHPQHRRMPFFAEFGE